MSRLCIILCTLFCLHSCALALIGTTAGGLSAAQDNRSIGAQIDDNTIEINANLQIIDSPRLSGHTHINVISMNGHVLLVGQAPNRELRQLAEQRVGEVKGVRQLHNQIRIYSNISLPSRTYDTWLTSKIKTKLLANDRIKSQSIKVVTENSEVFLMGIVSTQQAQLATDIARNVDGVKKVFRIFEIE